MGRMIATHLLLFHIIGRMFQYVQYHVKLSTVLAVVAFNLKINAFEDGLINTVLAICLQFTCAQCNMGVGSP